MSKTNLEPEDIIWKYHKHITATTFSHFAYRNDKFGIQWEQITNRDGHGWVGKPKNYYFIDDVEREFTDIGTLCDCWNERNDFDDPNNEITWVKKVVKTIKLKPKNPKCKCGKIIENSHFYFCHDCLSAIIH